MTPEEAPIGSVVIVGRHEMGQTATKQQDGRWLYNVVWEIEVSYDDLHKASCLIYSPEDPGLTTG